MAQKVTEWEETDISSTVMSYSPTDSPNTLKVKPWLRNSYLGLFYVMRNDIAFVPFLLESEASHQRKCSTCLHSKSILGKVSEKRVKSIKKGKSFWKDQVVGVQTQLEETRRLEVL